MGTITISNIIKSIGKSFLRTLKGKEEGRAEEGEEKDEKKGKAKAKALFEGHLLWLEEFEQSLLISVSAQHLLFTPPEDLTMCCVQRATEQERRRRIDCYGAIFAGSRRLDPVMNFYWYSQLGRARYSVV
jgi:hypothetical protein